MKSVRSNFLLRATVILVTAGALAGPAPGRIGGCNSEVATVDPVSYCIRFESYVCARDFAATRIDEEQRMQCEAAIIPTCEGANFPIGCVVTTTAADACIAALGNPTTLDVVATRGNPGFAECNVCGGSGGGVDPEGI